MVHNQYLMQYLSNIAQRNVKTAAISELSAFGSANNAVHYSKEINYSTVYIPKMDPRDSNFYIQEWHNWINKLS